MEAARESELEKASALIRDSVAKTGGLDTVWAEALVRAAAMSDAARLLESVYNEAAAGFGGSGSHALVEREVLTAVGPVRLRRAYVWKSGKGRYPADEALGLLGRYTPAAASLICWAGAQCGSFGAAEECLRRVGGIGLSGRQIQRLVNGVAPAAETWAAARPQDERPGGRILNIQYDMTGVPMRPEELVGAHGKDGPAKCRQVKAGIVFWQQENADGEIQKIPDSATHVVTYSDSPDFGGQLFNEALKRRYCDARTVVITSDGAEWIWLLAEARFKGAVQIVDFFHAAEHLCGLCRLAEPAEEQAQELFKKTRRLMKRFGAACVIRRFDALSRGHANSDAIQSALSYFRTHAHRMRYGLFLKMGYMIGSGPIEADCKTLVGQRTKLSGQRWTRSGSLNVMRLRCLTMGKGNLYDDYWSSRRVVA